MHFNYSEIKQTFIDAIHDYNFLINKNYSEKSIMKLIGDRYQLSSIERSILYRGVFSSKENKFRKAKLTDVVEGSIFHIDTFNVLYTLASYLKGKILFVASDGILRDASEVHGKTIKKELLNKSIDLLFSFLCEVNPVEVNFYIDKPVSNSGKLKALLQDNLNNYMIKGNAELFQSADYPLKKCNNGVVATSDSVIVNKAKVKVADLSKAILFHHFQPKFVYIEKLISNT